MLVAVLAKEVLDGGDSSIGPPILKLVSQHIEQKWSGKIKCKHVQACMGAYF